ncbi:MAG: undecaprenyl/decaprenyl-phosphate alpha-N-acetylglucosaminyl 1-phosphate transferase [Phycisphaerales bacterium]|nr:MAG: undecaprenyl/decaprenyl-phosphate alpha-N-acetylglucosaminyl 1-phosphate transferase [Phycisphaerales bacterium]
MIPQISSSLFETQSPDVNDQIEILRAKVVELSNQVDQVAQAAGIEHAADHATRLSIFHGYIGVFFIAFLGTLLVTPIMRRLAVSHGIIDRPNEARKVHKQPIAYLGGVAVYAGLMLGILFSYIGPRIPGLLTTHATTHTDFAGDVAPVPLSVLLGLTIIMIIGLIDDVTGISPRVKVGGQLVAAAALAVENFGVKLATGFLQPIGMLIGNEHLVWNIPLPFSIPGLNLDHITLDVIYWTGTAIIAFAVIGLCNAANLIDGLDGLLTGTTAISSVGFLVLALGLALADDGPRDSQRIVLCLALFGACLGFLPHNFNPANIFLGDAGSMLLGFTSCVIILSFGDTGKTFIVVAGLLVFALPVIDTSLAIVRRVMARKSISEADDQHLHHMLKRSLGVKGAVFVLYGIAASFATLGVLISMVRARSIYAIALVIAAFIGVIAIKIARKKLIEEQANRFDSRPASTSNPTAEAPKSPATPIAPRTPTPEPASQ